MDPVSAGMVLVEAGGAMAEVWGLVQKKVGHVRARRRDLALEKMRIHVDSAYQHLPEGERLKAVEEALSGSDQAAVLLLEAATAMMEVIDETAIPYIAALYAQWAVMNRPLDRYFRSVGRLLKDATREEIAALKDILEQAEPLLMSSGGLATTRLELVERDGVINCAATPGARAGPKARADGTDGVDRMPIPAPRSWEVVFGLLKDHHLATDKAGGALNTVSGPHVLVFEERHMEGLKRLVTLMKG